MVFIYKEKERLVGFDIVLANKPGALESIAFTAKDYGLDIYYIEIESLTKEEYDLFVIYDFSGSRHFPEEFIEDLKKEAEYVKKAVISPDFKNIIFPSMFKPMEMGNARSIIFSEASIRGLITMIKENLGVDPGNALLYHIGYGIGQEVFETYIKPLDIHSVEDLEKLLVALFRGSRWGDIIEYTVEDDKIILKAVNLWECEVQKGFVDKPASHFVRGIAGGLFKSILNRDVVVKETKCIALGDPYCQFEINII